MTEEVVDDVSGAAWPPESAECAQKQELVDQILELVPGRVKSRRRQLWITYDDQADVLYVNFERPGRADDSELTEDDVIVRYREGEVVGITVLNASKRR